MNETVGGIALCHVIAFQTRILFGAQYGRVERAKKEKNPEELLLACLRIGWNDAFRHVSKNVDDVEEKKKDYLNKRKQKLDDQYCLKYGKVAQKVGNYAYDDYYCAVLASENGRVIHVFRDYLNAATTEEKCAIIQKNLDGLQAVFTQVKTAVCFGHMQKLFNIAAKMLLCLYLCRTHLGLSDDLFEKNLANALGQADCPIDAIILEQHKQKEMAATGVGNRYAATLPSITWSELSSEQDIEDYKAIQAAFRSKDYSGLYYDFTEWN